MLNDFTFHNNTSIEDEDEDVDFEELDNMGIVSSEKLLERAYKTLEFDEDTEEEANNISEEFMSYCKDFPSINGSFIENIKKEKSKNEIEKLVKAHTDQNYCQVSPVLSKSMDTKSILKYLQSKRIHFSAINNMPYVYCPSDGTWYCLNLDIGIKKLLAQLPYDDKVKLDLDKIKKVIYNISDYAELEIRYLDSDSDSIYLINFRDGVYDIRDGSIRPHSHEYTFTYCINANAYTIDDTYTESRLLRTYLNNSFNNDTVKITTLQEIMGVALSTIRNQKMAFFLLGKSNSGKSVCLNLIKMLMSQDFCSTLSFSQLNEKFATSTLLGKAINISGEMPELTDNRISTFKNIVGNDSITTSFKGKDSFTLNNNALLLFACNDMPSLSMPDQAFFNRIRILKYDISLDKSQWIDNLAYRLYSEEQGAVLRFAIEGLRQFIENGMELTYADKSTEYVDEYSYSCNSFVSFANDFIKPCQGNKLLSGDILESYDKYCINNRVKPIGSNKCSKILMEMFNTEKTTIGKAGNKGYTDLQLIELL